MEYIFSIVVSLTFLFLLAILYFLVKRLFPKIENDDWEERYVQMKREAKRLTSLQKYDYEQDLID